MAKKKTTTESEPRTDPIPPVKPKAPARKAPPAPRPFERRVAGYLGHAIYVRADANAISLVSNGAEAELVTFSASHARSLIAALNAAIVRHSDARIDARRHRNEHRSSRRS